MKQLSRWLVLGVAVLVIAFSVFMIASAADATAGKGVYDKKCATCHGPGGEGKDAMAKMLKVEFRHLGSKEVQDKKDADLRKDIVEGTGKMKPVKGLTDAELDNVIAYLRTVKQK